MLYISFESESASCVTGLNRTGSAVDAVPTSIAKKNAARMNEPLLSVSNAEYGRRLLIKSPTPSDADSETVSTVIGMRGSFTIKIERSPVTVRRREEATITPPVQMPVLKSIFVSRRRLNAMTAVKNTTGTTIYRPNLTTISVTNETAAATCSFPKGRINANAAPNSAPIRYFIQSFIQFPYSTVTDFARFRG